MVSHHPKARRLITISPVCTLNPRDSRSSEVTTVQQNLNLLSQYQLEAARQAALARQSSSSAGLIEGVYTPETLAEYARALTNTQGGVTEQVIPVTVPGVMVGGGAGTLEGELHLGSTGGVC